mmetsp:Transcript_13977/g.19434  ORF Transcript_13977/g.19434 Transcript_13977/m.19434 type:complete len:189 (-) Transcript_13977:77-643(-)
MSQNTPIKVVVIGDSGVGKTCLCSRFSRDSYPADNIPVLDSCVFPVNINKKLLEINLWDTHGSEDYDRLRPLSYPGTNAVLICFSLVDRNSLDNVIYKWQYETRFYCNYGIPIVLVGTKRDLRLNHLASEANFLPITFDEGVQKAQQINAASYCEISSLKGEGVKEAFNEAILGVLKTDPSKGKCVLM